MLSPHDVPCLFEAKKSPMLRLVTPKENITRQKGIRMKAGIGMVCWASCSSTLLESAYDGLYRKSFIWSFEAISHGMAFRSGSCIQL